jgi:hypothetical protein
MDSPKYFIINPLQIEIFLSKKKIKKFYGIEEKFYNKMEKLKNISFQNKQIKNMIQTLNNRYKQ